MANVLPPEVQKKVWGMYRARFVLILSIVLIVLSGLTALALFPSYIALYVAAPSLINAADSSVDVGDAAISLERSQTLIRELLPVLTATSSAMATVENALSVKPTGVRITRLTYSSGTEGKIILIGSGTRDGVSAYKDALVGLGIFSGIAVPVSALVGSNGGTFSVVLTGNF